ncbi:Uncharacterised protein [Streptococcus pneumoniae]|nr:Uncharacterised protein [Streptococcus pneumoniae]
MNPEARATPAAGATSAENTSARCSRNRPVSGGSGTRRNRAISRAMPVKPMHAQNRAS